MAPAAENTNVTTSASTPRAGTAKWWVFAVGFALGLVIVFAFEWDVFACALWLGIILAGEFVAGARAYQRRRAVAAAEWRQWRRDRLADAAQQAGIGIAAHSDGDGEAMQPQDWDIFIDHGWTPGFLALLHRPSCQRVPDGFLTEVARGLFGSYDPAIAYTWFTGLASDRIPALYQYPQIVAAAVRQWIATFGADLAPYAYAAGLALPDAVAMHVAGTLEPEVLRALARMRGVEPFDPSRCLLTWTAQQRG